MDVNLKQPNIPVQDKWEFQFDTGFASLTQFAKICDELDDSLKTLASISDGQTQKRIVRLRKTIKWFEPSVTIIGQVKAGKTSLLNAMIGCPDMLPADVNPWTSVVTSLHLNPKKTGSETSSKFCFFNLEEWNGLLAKGGRLGELASRAGADDEMGKLQEQLAIMQENSRTRLGRRFELLLGQQHEYQYFDQELIERYVCLGELADETDNIAFGDGQGRFADVTKSADLYMHQPRLPTKLCLRDTPGVNDTFMVREQTTIRAIRESRLCVVVLSAHQALSSVDMALIRLITNIKSREVLIFVNRIDELHNPAQQIPEIYQSILHTLKSHNGPKNPRIVFGSAFWANCSLAGTPEEIEAATVAAMAELPDFNKHPDDLSRSAISWHLSGLPNLFQALADRIVEGEGAELIETVVQSALNLANGINLRKNAAIQNGSGKVTMSMEQDAIADMLDRLEENCRTTWEDEFLKLKASFEARLDISHNSFLERATSSLLTHLQTKGEDHIWEYSADGLRMMLNSAYVLFGTKLHRANKTVFGTCATNVTALHESAFSNLAHVEAVQFPPTARIPPPVFLGQTIALDLKGPWWKSWWRKRKGHQAFAESFFHMIKAETDPIVSELKVRQTEAIKSEINTTLVEFFADQRAIFATISDHSNLSNKALESILSGSKAADIQARLDTVLVKLNALTPLHTRGT